MFCLTCKFSESVNLNYCLRVFRNHEQFVLLLIDISSCWFLFCRRNLMVLGSKIINNVHSLRYSFRSFVLLMFVMFVVMWPFLKWYPQSISFSAHNNSISFHFTRKHMNVSSIHVSVIWLTLRLFRMATHLQQTILN